MDERPVVPPGIDHGSWLDFEQRIQQRRFHALIESARQALDAGDRRAALEALAEARALNPDAVEVRSLERLAVTHADTAPSLTPAPPRRRPRTFVLAAVAVAALLVFAVSTLRGPVEAPAQAPLQEATVSAPPPAPTTGMAADVVDPPARPEPPSPLRDAGSSAMDLPRPTATPAPPPTEEERVAFALRRYGRTFTGLNFRDCAITLQTTSASAVCLTGPASMAAASTPTWDVELSRGEEGWQIDRAVARE